MKIKFIFKAKVLISLIMLTIASITLNACGKKGGPYPPAGEDNVYPRTYPAE